MNVHNLAALLARHPPTLEEAYEAGRDCAANGASTTNCHFSFFATPELTRAWERGRREHERHAARMD
jgi:hypothetical protein